MGKESANVLVDCFVKLFVSQLSTRVVTFTLNLLSARYLSIEDYGLQAVQFELINSTILQLSREGFRRAGLRAVEASRPQLLRFLLPVIPLGAAVTAAVCSAWLWVHAGAGPQYANAVWLQGMAAFIEILSEPLYVMAQVELRFGLRARIDTVATLTKALALLGLLSHGGLGSAYSFCAAQLLYSAVILAGYSAAYAPDLLLGRRAETTHKKREEGEEEGGRLLPRAAGGGGLVGMWASFTVQAAEKLVLAKGSSAVISLVKEQYDQGLYGMVNHLGSLVVRMVFAPFEEATFTAFSAGGAQAAASKSALQRQGHLLGVLVRCISIVGLTSAAFGPSYAQIVVWVLYPRWRDSGAPAALGAYSAYVLLMALNGVLEAFVHAVANPRQLAASNAALIAFSAMHMAVSVKMVQAAGVLGLIAADGLNMLLRVSYCLVFVARRFAPPRDSSTSARGGSEEAQGNGPTPFSMRSLAPSNAVLAATAAVAASAAASSAALMHPQAVRLPTWLAQHVPAAAYSAYVRHAFLVHAACHTAFGLLLLAGLMAVAYRSERQGLRQFMAMRKGGGGTTDGPQREDAHTKRE